MTQSEKEEKPPLTPPLCEPDQDDRITARFISEACVCVDQTQLSLRCSMKFHKKQHEKTVSHMPTTTLVIRFK